MYVVYNENTAAQSTDTDNHVLYEVQQVQGRNSFVLGRQVLS